ncbi:MAG: hypothetical protein GXY77_19690, partial [Fibrobacter sp.]|nr:hypothetical protein [Fibrobacter sp.]
FLSPNSLSPKNQNSYQPVLSLPAEQLPNGVYTVTIKNTDGEKLYCDPSTDGKTSQYTLSFKASFTMNTLIGMIEIVNGLPITLEEIFLMHYPAEYGHLSASLLSFTEYNEVKQGEKPPFQLAQSSLSLSYAVAQAIKEKNSFISGKIQLYGNIGGGGGDDSNDSTDETSTGNNNTSKKVKAIGNYTKKFIPDIIEKIGSECPEVAKGYQMWKNVTGTANSIKTIYETWTVNKAIFTLIDAQKDLSALQKVYQSVMGANLYSKYGKEVIDHVLENLKSSEIGKLATFSKTNSSAAMDFLLETDGPAEKILEAQKSTFSQIMNYVDLAFSAIDTVAAFSKCWELSASLADEKKKFFHILHSMNTLDIPFGSRGSTATVVKSRIGVDKFAQGVKAQDIKAAWAAFDLVCSVASFTPAAPIAGAIKVIKDTAEATKMLIVNSLDLLESSYPNNMATRAWTQFKDNKTTENEKWSNYQLLGDPDMEKHFPSSADKEKLKDMNAQARILAEAIRGLMSLINHINCPIYKDYTGARKTVDYSEFDKKFNKLKISEYIDRFIYGKGFLMPKNPILSIGLDQIWGYMASDFWSYETTVENITPDRQYIGVIPTNPNADVFNHWKADFHKYFPIHKTENTSHNFAHIFSRNYSGADAQLNYTQIYYRHVTDVNADDAKDKPWLHLSNIADIQNAITTDTQIRILLVFANDIRHVPLKIQLIRIETGFDIAGPEYLVTPGVLKSQKDGGVLLDEEKDFQNKIGAVVYPFYIFANATRYGVRPVDASDGVIGYAKQKFWKGNTEDISNQYEFSVFVGKAKLPVFFGEKPFYYDTGKNITNFNYLMSHNLTSSKFF